MKDYCRCCGKWRCVKDHEGLLLYPSCVQKIRTGKEKSIAEIKEIHKKFDAVINAE